MNYNPVPWFEIYVLDSERARKFYKEVFNLETTEMELTGFDGQMYSFPSNEEGSGASGALVKSNKHMPSADGTIVYFACDNIDSTLEKVILSGGKILENKEKAGEFGFCALIIDSEGNKIGMYSMQ